MLCALTDGGAEQGVLFGGVKNLHDDVPVGLGLELLLVGGGPVFAFAERLVAATVLQDAARDVGVDAGGAIAGGGAVGGVGFGVVGVILRKISMTEYARRKSLRS